MKKRTMLQSIVITRPNPTPEQVAKNYGVSQERLKELGAMVDEFLSKSSASRIKKGKNETWLSQSSYGPKEKNEYRLKLARSF
jgi:hypothetical protein